MGSLETLPPDQRAVLDLVLRRGRSYDDIARLLAIDRAAVRARALAAFDQLGPETGVADESRALITDYLLGQLPEQMGAQTRERLASSASERAWARVLASELAPVAGKPLPEIPDGSAAEGPSDRPSSRRGGAIMLGVGALAAVALLVVLLAVLNNGSSKHASAPAASGTAAANAAGTPSTSTSGSKAQLVAQNNLDPPAGSSSPAKGVGVVVKSGNAYGIIIEAAHVPPNNHNAYAAWLYNSPTDAYRLGFVNPAVGQAGTLQVGSLLPTNAGHFGQLLLTTETQSNPKTPGPIMLQGSFKGVPATG